MARTKQRTPELRARILAAAISILSRRGVAGLTARSVASAAETSTPAVYELFGDKEGLIREVFVEGFRRLGERVARLEQTDRPLDDLAGVAMATRSFLVDEPELGQVMFSRPFADFDPGSAELEVAATVRTAYTRSAQRAIDAGCLTGDATDIAHVVLAMVQGLWSQERAGWLGTSVASVERRWRVALDAVLSGSLTPGAQS